MAGVVWWVAVFLVPPVREATLGQLDPWVTAVFDIPLFVGASALACAGVRAAAVVATVWTALVTLGLAVFATITTEAGWGVLAMTAASVSSVAALCFLVLGRIPVDWVLRGPFAFRPAAERTTTRPHVVTTFVQLIIFWGLFLGAIPLAINVLERRWALNIDFPPTSGVLGGVLLLLASALGVYAAIAMSTQGQGTPLPAAMPNRLVIAGPYRWIRNPMAAAGIVQGAAVGLILGSWMVVGYAVAGSLVWNYAVRPLEEADLRMRFGAEFDAYCRDVRCWIPSFRT
ncbi:methyltransferase family protein [Paenarthrobacter sp. NPDC058040]|uniref:methyltransferase family protein n=1 Tax=unclassified Paenarthrobacter TaxID=2634190 RepID=UPI0036DEC58C